MYGIYIHIPFCAQKCSYCDFLSYPVHDDRKQSLYIEALIKEIELRVTEKWANPVSIFIGGGTPTVLSAGLLKKLMHGIAAVIDITKVEEFTVEANPGTVDAEKLYELQQGGVNRLSFGVQSFDTALLKVLGRIHTASQVHEAVSLARAQGINNINLDLMYGLPSMNQRLWQETLQQAIDLVPSHLSLYQLIVEPQTKIAQELLKQQLPAVDEDLAAAQFDWQREWLKEYGYQQYEISNYAKENRMSIHNTLYWRLDNYLGLGLGATGWERPVRTTNTTAFHDYIYSLLEKKTLPPQTNEVLSLEEQMSESAFMGLRMNQGIDMIRFNMLYERNFLKQFEDAIDEGSKKGWLVQKDHFLTLTDAGRRMGNWVFELFL